MSPVITLPQSAIPGGVSRETVIAPDPSSSAASSVRRPDLLKDSGLRSEDVAAFFAWGWGG